MQRPDIYCFFMSCSSRIRFRLLLNTPRVHVQLAITYKCGNVCHRHLETSYSSDSVYRLRHTAIYIGCRWRGQQQVLEKAAGFILPGRFCGLGSGKRFFRWKFEAVVNRRTSTFEVPRGQSVARDRQNCCLFCLLREALIRNQFFLSVQLIAVVIKSYNGKR